jgi:MFS family permease
MLATFMVAMEATIVATAMPRIVGQIGGFAYYSWVFSAYLLAQCTMTVNSPSAHWYKPLRIPSPFDLDV